MLSIVGIGITLGVWLPLSVNSRVAQWKRAGPITQRSVDRNYALLVIFVHPVNQMAPALLCFGVAAHQRSCPISAEDSALDF